MKKILLLLWMTVMALQANDGAYTMSGNHLIPIYESNISVKKEILTIKKVCKKEECFLEVDVAYTFFNPNEKKTLLVGFEAAAPSGDVDGTPKNGGHPYMKGFSVKVNGQNIAHKVVPYTEEYLKDGKIVSEDVNKLINDPYFNGNNSEIAYVYYFEMTFEKGNNYVHHNYSYHPSGGVMSNFEIDYILSAASRWAKGVIKDFTLIIDVGEFQQFVIANTFFKNGDEWEVDGLTKQTVFDESFPKEEQTEATQFYVQKSPLIFKKKNFKIEGELNLVSKKYYKKFHPYGEDFNYLTNDLHFNLSHNHFDTFLPSSRLSYKIYKNFPYARQGYVFKNQEMQKYFEKLDWYKRNPNYKIGSKLLSQYEKELYEAFDELSLRMLKNLPYAKRGYVFKTDDLQMYFQNQSWYKKNSKYKATLANLSEKEQRWLKKIKLLALKDIKNMYHFVDEYNAIYDNCLHKHEKDKVYDFMRRLTLMDKKQIEARFSKQDLRIVEEDLIGAFKTELTQDTLEQYINNFSDKYDTFSVELYEDEKNKGCYEYLFTHGHGEPEDSTSEYGFFIGIGKENGAFKIVRLTLAG